MPTYDSIFNHPVFGALTPEARDTIARQGGKPTRAEAARWLDAHLGCTIETIQTSPDHGTWMPLDRTLSKRSKAAWLLDGSTVVLSPTHTVSALSDEILTLQWHDEAGALIHTTTYRVVNATPTIPVIVAYQCTECDAVHCTFDAAAACHHGIGGVVES